MKFYDYVEIQLLSCYRVLMHRCKYVKTNDKTNERIIILVPEFKETKKITKII